MQPGLSREFESADFPSSSPLALALSGMIITPTPVAGTDPIVLTDTSPSFVGCSGGVTQGVTLPAVPSAGRIFVVANVTEMTGGGPNTITIDGNGNNIENSPTYLMATGTVALLWEPTVTQWLVVASGDISSSADLLCDTINPINGVVRTVAGSDYKIFFTDEDGTGNGITIAGFLALFNRTIGVRNTGVGVQAMLNLTIGNDNIAIGQFSLLNLIDGNNNVAVGSDSAVNCTGDGNVVLGMKAGRSLTTGDQNVIIGQRVGETGYAGQTNILAIDNSNVAPGLTLIYGDFTNREIVFNARVKEIGSVRSINVRGAGYITTKSDYTILFDTTLGVLAMTLSNANAIAGQIYIFKATALSANTLTITPSAGLIDGGATLVLTPVAKRQAVTVQFDGTNWHVISSNDLV